MDDQAMQATPPIVAVSVHQRKAPPAAASADTPDTARGNESVSSSDHSPVEPSPTKEAHVPHLRSVNNKTLNLNYGQVKYHKDSYTGTFSSMEKNYSNKMVTVLSYYCDATLYFNIDIPQICSNFVRPASKKPSLTPLLSFLKSFNALENKTAYTLFEALKTCSNTKALWMMVDYILRPVVTEAASDFEGHEWDLSSSMLTRLGYIKKDNNEDVAQLKEG